MTLKEAYIFISEHIRQIHSNLEFSKNEIDFLRKLVFRYYLKYGDEIFKEKIDLPDSIQFSIGSDKKTKIIDYKDIGLKNQWEDFLNFFKKNKN